MFKNKATERAIAWIKKNPDRFKRNQKRYRDKKKLSMTEEERNRLKEKQREQSKTDKYKLRSSNYSRNKRLTEDPESRKTRLERKRKWDIKNKEYCKQYRKERYAIIYPINREKILNDMRNKNINNRIEVLYWYSDGKIKCNRCEEAHYEFLAVDHINNNGYEHRKSGALKKYGNNICKFLIKNNFPEGYQILCHNCNQIKRTECHPPKNTACTRHHGKYRKSMLEKYSNGNVKCKYCGTTDDRCLTFHHVDNDGSKERKKIGNKSIVSYLYHNDIPLNKIEVLCQNCNQSLGWYGYLPS